VQDLANTLRAPVEETLEPVGEVVGTVDEVVDPIVAPVRDQVVGPIVSPLKDEVVDPVIDPVVDPIKNQIVDPVLNPIKDVVSPVEDTVDPIVKPVVDPIQDAIDPVQDTVGPVIEDVTLPAINDAPPASAPVPAPVDGAAAPATAPATIPTTAPATTLSPTPAVSAPVAGTGLDPVVTEGGIPFGGQTYFSPQMGAIEDHRPALSTPGMGWETSPSGGSSSLSSQPAAPVGVQQVGMPQGTLEGALGAALVSSSPDESMGTKEAFLVRTTILSGLRSVEANPSLIGAAAALAALDHHLLAQAKGFLEGMPLSSLPAGAMPAAPGGPSGASGGSGGSSGGGGFELIGALALLSAMLLGGKHLRSAREFIKPSSALLAIIERPG
ncbi:MAG TPA: hypothetical protein VGW38_14700, partial [Chloroflexota bacterium]|nr:hypothetical protein [Chloroflexota bacterium]